MPCSVSVGAGLSGMSFVERRPTRSLTPRSAPTWALETERRIDAGDSREEARRAASRDFGNVLLVKEVTRDMSGWGFVEGCGQDLRLAGRALRKHRLMTVVATLSLALAIAGNTTAFSLVSAFIFHTWPYEDPAQLVVMFQTNTYQTAGLDPRVEGQLRRLA